MIKPSGHRAWELGSRKPYKSWSCYGDTFQTCRSLGFWAMDNFQPHEHLYNSWVKTHRAANSVACTQKRPLLFNLQLKTQISSLNWSHATFTHRLSPKVTAFHVEKSFKVKKSSCNMVKSGNPACYSQVTPALSPLFRRHTELKASWTWQNHSGPGFDTVGAMKNHEKIWLFYFLGSYIYLPT